MSQSSMHDVSGDSLPTILRAVVTAVVAIFDTRGDLLVENALNLRFLSDWRQKAGGGRTGEALWTTMPVLMKNNTVVESMSYQQCIGNLLGQAGGDISRFFPEHGVHKSGYLK